MVVKTEMEIALEALDRIATHEKECGERWLECILELKELRKATDNHAARWEKLSWLVVSSVFAGVLSVIVTHVG